MNTGQLPFQYAEDLHIPVNTTVEGADAGRLSRQASDIYAALMDGPKFNIELVSLPNRDGKRRFIHNMTARISEIRNWLNPRGRDVLAYRLPDGIWLYKIGPCHTTSSSEHRICVGVHQSNGYWVWKCPCCDVDNVATIAKRELKQIEKNPVCEDCQKRLESPCPK
jgi:hypothetical protein